MPKEHFSYFTTPNRIDYQPLFRKMSPLRIKEQTWVMAEIKPLSQKKNNRDSIPTCSLVFFPIIFFVSNQSFFTGILAWKIVLYMLQVKIEFRLKFFNLGFSTSFVSWPKFMNDQGQKTKKIENQPRLENFHLNLILISALYKLLLLL